ncbi:MAG: hypothetical protein AAF799_28570 [Myxococcota bacterium]
MPKTQTDPTQPIATTAQPPTTEEQPPVPFVGAKRSASAVAVPTTMLSSEAAPATEATGPQRRAPNPGKRKRADWERGRKRGGRSSSVAGRRFNSRHRG